MINEEDAEKEYSEFKMMFDNKYGDKFKDLDHPYIFIGAAPCEEGNHVFVAGDLHKASMQDLIMMRSAFATAFDKLMADKVTISTTGLKRKVKNEEVSSKDTKTYSKVTVMTTGLSLLYKFLLDIAEESDVKLRSQFFDNVMDIVLDLEGLVQTLELPDVMDMKINVLIDGIKERDTADKHIAGLTVLSKEIVDHYMEEQS